MRITALLFTLCELLSYKYSGDFSAFALVLVTVVTCMSFQLLTYLLTRLIGFILPLSPHTALSSRTTRIDMTCMANMNVDQI